MNGRRDRIEIIVNILHVADGAKKTQIMYKANLSFTQLKDYLSFLLKTNLLEDNEGVYSVTQKGKLFFKKYVKLNELLQDDPSPKHPYVNNSLKKI